MVTHRCKGSLEARCPIRYTKRHDWQEDAPCGWHMYHMEHHLESLRPFDLFMNHTAEIQFCPFCGEKLEVSK